MPQFESKELQTQIELKDVSEKRQLKDVVYKPCHYS